MKRTVVSLAVVFLLATVSWAQVGPGMMGGFGYGMGLFGTVIMIVFWVLVIGGIVFLIRWLAVFTRSEGRGARSENSALEILKRRYASGEINKDEFEEKKKSLQ